MKLNITINLHDGTEFHDIEAEAAMLQSIPSVVENVLAEQAVSDSEWSSLVIVVVADRS